VSIPLVGSSTEMTGIGRRLDAIARAERTTLISGPTGCGKDVIAHSLHERSRRSSAPLIVVHCAALPDNLIEAELFGHAKGAFTGAYQARSGLVRSAEHGSLFLDEIDSLSLGAQAKLLRFLETGEFRAVGADHAERSDAWVIAATNQELRARVRDRAFREDLLYRLEVVRIDVPALAHRPDDIAVLADHFLRGIGCGHKRFTAAAQRRMRDHDWPGNVRELRHRVESAALLYDDDDIDEAALGLPSEPAGESNPEASAGAHHDAQGEAGEDGMSSLRAQLWRMVEETGMTLAQATLACEDMLVSAALQAERNNRTRAAARLGINVRTIYKKLCRDDEPAADAGRPAIDPATRPATPARDHRTRRPPV
jgi:DNA-binding NtrC family response regulator